MRVCIAGSPTCVGMDLRPWWGRLWRAWLPHMRGDGPSWVLMRFSAAAAPPHAWGWTLASVGAACLFSGSPTCVGMDLLFLHRTDQDQWLPHMRGDGPVSVRGGLHPARAPPHAWGWTQAAEGAGRRRRGSPTCVGMDLDHCANPMPRSGLPHMRGDGPVEISGNDISVMAPPHAWGWTPASSLTVSESKGSPTCVGMDLVETLVSFGLLRLPHMRGDGPLGDPAHRSPAGAPPHAWGWTRPQPPLGGRPIGSPTCVGMDPLNGLSASGRGGLPHMRGDGPLLPAVAALHGQAPPHAWGWTVMRCGRILGDQGSPTCVGMDLTSPAPRGIGAWLPHMRGDGPPPPSYGLVMIVAPPHAWGWTP